MQSTRPPDSLIAHVELIRAVDRLLEQAQTVREKRDALDQLVTKSVTPTDSKGGRDDGR